MPAKTASKKTASVKVSTKAKAVETVAAKPLSPNQLRILSALTAQGPLTRSALVAQCGFTKGYSKAIGAATKDAQSPGSLIGRGYVTADDSGTALTYKATASGKRAATEANKTPSEASKADGKAKAATKAKATPKRK